jgi:holo-[acyl-carrier protein] synthase
MKPIPHIAGRFAVKEAVAKALTTGWSGGFRWKDVEVHNEESGKPTVVFHGKMKEIVGNGQVLISLSHSEHIVVAYAMLQS